MKEQSVFFISDGTGITAEKIGRSLLTQFPTFSFRYERLSFVRGNERAEEAIAKIKRARAEDGIDPIVFSTFVYPEVTQAISSAGACIIDLFSVPTQKLEKHLGEPSAHIEGRTQAMGDLNIYQQHMDAINYTVEHDDARRIDRLDKADVIVVGLSRSGKTPTCMYLAMQYFIKAANYPITPDDLGGPIPRLPPELVKYRKRLVGLIIEPKRLSEIRQRRKQGSLYASLETCKSEVKKIRSLYADESIYSIDTTKSSVPEIAVRIMSEMNLYMT